MEREPIQYDKTCMRCPPHAEVLCLQKGEKRVLYDKMTHNAFPQIGTIQECPIYIKSQPK